MATLTIRNLPDEVHHRLRIRAALNERSMEAEARALLDEALQERTSEADISRILDDFHEALKQANGGELPMNAVDELIAQRRREASAELAEIERFVNGKK